MKRLKNKAYLIGCVGVNATVSATEKKEPMVRFSIATYDKYKNSKGETVKETQWHNIVAFGSLADQIVKYCKAGVRVMIEGKIVNSIHTDVNGTKRYVTEIYASDLMILSAIAP